MIAWFLSLALMLHAHRCGDYLADMVAIASFNMCFILVAFRRDVHTLGHEGR